MESFNIQIVLQSSSLLMVVVAIQPVIIFSKKIYRIW